MRDIDLRVSRALLRGSKVVPKNIQSILKSISDAKKLASARTLWNLRRVCLAPCRKKVSQNRLWAGSIFFGTTLGWSWATPFVDLTRNEYPSRKWHYKSWSSSFSGVKYRPESCECSQKCFQMVPNVGIWFSVIVLETVSKHKAHEQLNFWWSRAIICDRTPSLSMKF